MLRINQLNGFGGKRGATAVRTITYQSTANSGVVSYPITFSSQAIGTASSDRFIVVCLSISNPAATPSAVTVAGQSCTRVVQANGGRNCEIWITDAAVTGGTTASIVLSGSGTVDAQCAAFSLTGGTTATAHATSSDTTDPLSASINVPANGCVVATSICETATWSLTGVTTRYTDGTGNYESGGGSDNYTAAQTGMTVSSAGGTPHALAVASFGP